MSFRYNLNFLLDWLVFCWDEIFCLGEIFGFGEIFDWSEITGLLFEIDRNEFS